MAYEKQEWRNLPDQSTPMSAERLRHMEDGIYEVSLRENKMTKIWSGQSNSGNIELGNINDYDLLLVTAKGGQYTRSSVIIPISEIDYYVSGDVNSYRWGVTIMQTTGAYATASFYFTNNDNIITLNSINPNSAGWSTCYLTSIYGIKLLTTD